MESGRLVGWRSAGAGHRWPVAPPRNRPARTTLCKSARACAAPHHKTGGCTFPNLTAYQRDLTREQRESRSSSLCTATPAAARESAFLHRGSDLKATYFDEHGADDRQRAGTSLLVQRVRDPRCSRRPGYHRPSASRSWRCTALAQNRPRGDGSPRVEKPHEFQHVSAPHSSASNWEKPM